MKFVSKNRMALSVVALFLALFIFSCKKENAEKEKSVSQAEAEEFSKEGMEAESSFDDIQDIGMTAADEEGVISAGRPEGVAGRPFPFFKLRLRIGVNAIITVTPDDNTYPKKVTIDFGDGQICPDGKFRKGKIILNISAPIRNTGSVATITLDGFQLGRVKVEGTKIITNLSTNGTIKFSAQVTNGKVTYPGGRGYLYEKLKYITQTAGTATTDIIDDIYKVEGSAKVTLKNGIAIIISAKEALVKKVSCPWVSEGVLNVKIGSFAFLLDYNYGNSTDCDNKALLKWNSNQALILLP